jgi:DNA-binding transcriptional ArsR family regulator
MMNPLMECLADLMLWDSHPDLMRYRRDEILPDFQPPLRLVNGVAGPYKGLLTLMLFEQTDWFDALMHIAESDSSRWRDAIIPAGTDSDRVLKALSSAELSGELLASAGYVVDKEAAATYAAWLSNPRALKLAVVELLDQTWRQGFGVWWNRESPSSRGTLKHSKMQVHQEYFVRVPLLGMAEGEVEIAQGDVAMLLVPSIRKTVTGETPKEPMTGGNLDEARLVECLAALADPTRLAVLRILAAGPSYPTVMAKSLGMSGPSMSHHIMCLKHAGLIETTRTGGFVRVGLRRDAYEAAIATLQSVLPDASGERN